MTMKCLACGADGEGEVVYPYPEDNLAADEPIERLLTIEAAGTNEADGYRLCIMCHECWHRLASGRGIDMWISQECWESLSPVTPFASLPVPQYRREDGTVLPAYEPGAYIIWQARHYLGGDKP